MNDRTRQLALEAGFRIAGLNYEYICATGVDGICSDELDRFAKMIIEDCIDCIRGAGLTDEAAERNNLGFNDGISEAVINTQKHFGVEE